MNPFFLYRNLDKMINVNNLALLNTMATNQMRPNYQTNDRYFSAIKYTYCRQARTWLDNSRLRQVAHEKVSYSGANMYLTPSPIMRIGYLWEGNRARFPI